MRKLFHTTAALSVLLATSMAANAAPAFFSWTGFYLGGNIVVIPQQKKTFVIE